MSEVKSKVPGVVDEVKSAAGDKIEKGQVVLVLEAMKVKDHLLRRWLFRMPPIRGQMSYSVFYSSNSICCSCVCSIFS